MLRRIAVCRQGPEMSGTARKKLFLLEDALLSPEMLYQLLMSVAEPPVGRWSLCLHVKHH